MTGIASRARKIPVPQLHRIDTLVLCFYDFDNARSGKCFVNFIFNGGRSYINIDRVNFQIIIFKF